MRHIVTLLCGLLALTSGAVGEPLTLDAHAQGAVTGPALGAEVLPAFSYDETVGRFQAKKPAILTAVALDLLYAGLWDVTIEVYRTVGRGRNQHWRMLQEQTSVFPLVVFIPPKTADYLIVVRNPNPFPVFLVLQTN